MIVFHSAVAAAPTFEDLEKVVQAALGSSNLMEFARFNVATSCAKSKVEKGLESSA